MYMLILNASAQQKVILPFINNTSALRTDRNMTQNSFYKHIQPISIFVSFN